MKVAMVKEFKAHATQYFREQEPVLITRRGQIIGFFMPFEDPDQLPLDLRRELLQVLINRLSQKAEKKGMTEEKALAQFEEFRKARGRRKSAHLGADGRRSR